MAGILYTIVVILIVLWLVGFLVVHVTSPLIHLLLLIGVYPRSSAAQKSKECLWSKP